MKTRTNDEQKLQDFLLEDKNSISNMITQGNETGRDILSHVHKQLQDFHIENKNIELEHDNSSECNRERHSKQIIVTYTRYFQILRENERE